MSVQTTKIVTKIMIVSAVLAISSLGQGCSRNMAKNDLLLGGYERPLTTNGEKHAAVAAPAADKNYSGGLYAQFTAAIAASKGEIDNKAKALAMLKSGQALGRGACIEFFHTMGQEQQIHDINKSAVALGSNVVTGILALADASTEVIAGSAIGFGILESSSDIRQIHILFNPDTSAIEALILSALDLHTATTLANAGQSTDYGYVDAYSDLLDYERICTVHSIKSLVNSAVSRGELEAVSGKAQNQLSELLRDETTLEIREAIAKDVEALSISDEQLFALWWLFEEGPTDPEANEAICPHIKDFKNSPCPDGKTDVKFSKAQEIKKQLQKLMPQLRAELRGQVRLARDLRKKPPGEPLKALNSPMEQARLLQPSRVGVQIRVR